ELSVSGGIDTQVPRSGVFSWYDPRGGLCAGEISQSEHGHCLPAFGLEDLRGPHNLWRLIRTGATLERTGAMRVILDAYEAPRLLRVTLRVMAWPFQWLGLKGDPSMPPATRALTALGPAYIKFGQIL